MKFLGVIKAWVVAHKVAAIVIGSGATAVIATSVIVPVAVSNAKVEITWKNEDGSVLRVDKVKKGDLPSYDEEAPVKGETAQYSYTFSGWEPEVVKATENAEYTAKFSSEVRKYTVTWKNQNGDELEKDENVLYGATPEYNGDTPTQEKDAQYTYSFKSWDKEISAVQGDQIYTATYNTTLNKYTVTWKNYDGAVLETDENVEYGTLPSYDGADPERAKTAETTYDWNLWDKEVVAVTGDVTYTAHFDEAKRQYTFKFVDQNGTAIEGASYENIEYDVDPATVFDKENPQKESKFVVYDFDGWQRKESDEESITFEPKPFKAIVTKDEALEFTPIKDGAEYKVTSGYTAACGTYAGDELIIPSEHNGKPVTEIGGSAFYSYTKIKSIVIPKSIKKIGYNSFYICSAVESVLIEGAPEIESYAFYDLYHLKHFEIVGDVYDDIVDDEVVQKPVPYTMASYVLGYCATSLVEPETTVIFGEGLAEIPEYCFYYSRVKSVTIPDSVTKIGYDAFYYCRYLEEVNFGENPNVSHFAGYSFYSTQKLKSIELPSSLTRMDDCAFYDSGLESIEIPDSLVTIGYSIFGYCINMTHAKLGENVNRNHIINYMFQNNPIEEYELSENNKNLQVINGAIYSTDGTKLIKYNTGAEGDFEIPTGVTSIDAYAFYGAKKLGKVTLPEGIETIPNYCFAGSSMTEIDLPESLVSINDFAFYDSKLESLHFGKKVASFAASSIDKCSSLTTITVDAENTNFAMDDGVMYNPSKTKLYFVMGNKTGDFTVPSTVTTIGSYAFNKSSLSSVTVGDDVTGLGSYCFAYFQGEVTLGSGITIIPQYCFSNAQFKDGEFTIPSTVTTIQDHAFQYSNIASVSLPNACVTLETSAFYSCRSLATINLNKVETINDYCFYEVNKVTKVVIPDTCEKIGYCSMSYMTKLEEVEIGAVSNFGMSVFMYDSALKKVTMANDIEEIGASAFYYCQLLDDINIPTNLKYIGSYAFYYCRALESLTLPSTVKFIDNYAFYSLKTDTLGYSGTKAQWEAIGNYRYDEGLHRYVGRATYWQSGLSHVSCSDEVIDL